MSKGKKAGGGGLEAVLRPPHAGEGFLLKRIPLALNHHPLWVFSSPCSASGRGHSHGAPWLCRAGDFGQYSYQREGKLSLLPSDPQSNALSPCTLLPRARLRLPHLLGSHDTKAPSSRSQQDLAHGDLPLFHWAPHLTPAPSSALPLVSLPLARDPSPGQYPRRRLPHLFTLPMVMPQLPPLPPISYQHHH